MPLQATSGAASYDAFGGGVPVVPNYIEDVFSTYLYTGTGESVTQRIASGIDIATKGGMVWTKTRAVVQDHEIFDTARGQRKYIRSNTTDAEFDSGANSVQYKTSGWDAFAYVNETNVSFASWTFRKQPKFFDVVTFTATSSNDQRISHLLGSVPGCIMLKGVDVSSDWFVYHRSVNAPDARQYVTYLNSTVASQFGYGGDIWGASDPTSTDFGFKSGVHLTAGKQYVAYLFAHDAGGFGLTGTDNVISCGSYTGTGVSLNVSLGYEPQWILARASSTTANWRIFDNMRGWPAPSGQDAGALFPNLSNAETANGDLIYPTSTGFQLSTNGTLNTSGATYIYIAIRRGPMKVPTLGTSVFGLSARTGTGANATVTGGAGVSDAVIVKNRGSAVASLFSSRLTGTGYLVTSSDAAEVAAGTTILQANPWDVMDGVKVGTTSTITNASSNTFINYLFKRAPSFFDVVCYTGNGSTQNVSHNLGAVPELMIVKSRSLSGSDWWVYASALTTPQNKYLRLQSTDGESTATGLWGSSLPTLTTFGLGAFSPNSNGATFVAYLFATCAGVSKVGSYTGNAGYTVTVPCGFTAGVRFVLIKRTDSTGDWWVYDSARGITAGNDPYLYFNTTAAEVGGTDYIDSYSAGFEVTSTAPAGLNANGGTYIFLAIA